MVLSANHKKRLRRAIVDDFGGKERLDLFLDDEFSIVLANFDSAGFNYELLVRDILRDIEAKGNIRKLLEELLKEETTDTFSDEIQSILEEIIASEIDTNGHAIDPFKTFIINRRPYVNHDAIKNAAERLIQNSESVLRIDGPSLSGKTYSNYFFNFLSKETGCFKVLATVDLRDYRSASAKNWISYILAPHALDPNFLNNYDENATDVTRGKWLGQQTIESIKKLDRDYWLIIDHIDLNTDIESQEIIKYLVNEVTQDNPGNLKLILIGDSSWLPGIVSMGACEVKANPITEDELHKFIVGFGKKHELAYPVQNEEELKNNIRRLLRDNGPESGADEFPLVLMGFLSIVFPNANEVLT